MGYQVRPGLTDLESPVVVRVVGTLPGGGVIEEGEPIAIRRVPTEEEKRAAELLREAITEGKKGLQEAEERKRGVFAYQQLQACFRARMIS